MPELGDPALVTRQPRRQPSNHATDTHTHAHMHLGGQAAAAGDFFCGGPGCWSFLSLGSRGLQGPVCLPRGQKLDLSTNGVCRVRVCLHPYVCVCLCVSLFVYVRVSLVWCVTVCLDGPAVLASEVSCGVQPAPRCCCCALQNGAVVSSPLRAHARERTCLDGWTSDSTIQLRSCSRHMMASPSVVLVTGHHGVPGLLH